MAESVTTLTVVLESWVRIPAIDKTFFSRIFGNQRPIKQRHVRHLASRSTHDDSLCDCTMKYRVRVHDEGSSCSPTMTVLREHYTYQPFHILWPNPLIQNFTCFTPFVHLLETPEHWFGIPELNWLRNTHGAVPYQNEFKRTSITAVMTSSTSVTWPLTKLRKFY